MMNEGDMEEAWRTVDSIRSVAEAVTGLSVWELSFSRQTGCYRLELSRHLTEEQAYDLCSQLYIPADYDGEGSHGSLFTLRTNNNYHDGRETEHI